MQNTWDVAPVFGCFSVFLQSGYPNTENIGISLLYNNYSETRNFIVQLTSVKDQTILHGKFKFTEVILQLPNVFPWRTA